MTDDVSLNGSPTVSPTTRVVEGVPFALSSTSTTFLALSQAPAGVRHEERLEEAEERDRDEVPDEEVRLDARERGVPKNTVRKMLNMPFCAYCVQISTTFLESVIEDLLDAFELDVRLDELDGAVCARRDGLGRRAGEPVNRLAPPAMRPSRKGGWEGESFAILSVLVRPSVRTTMMLKIIVVAPTTAYCR
ncbi:MAG: hypothetical protein U0235_03700 [Polyangiaceae bacterium]